MAYDTRTDHGIMRCWVSNLNWTSYSNCLNDYRQWNSYYDQKNPKSSVTSYRGKQLYVDVGGNKRKMYHPFERYRIQFDATKCDQWYCTPAQRLWTQNHQSNGWAQDSRLYPLAGPKGSGDVCPFVHPTAMSTFAEDIRRFVVRDLHVKANAPDFDGAVFLAELDETVRELYRILKAPIEMLYKSQAKKKRPFLERSTGISALLLNPEELWLWFRYFLMPAMMDAEDILAAIKGHKAINRVQAGDRSEEPLKLSGSYDFLYGSSFPGTLEWESEYTYGAGGAMDIAKRFDPNRWGTSAWDVLRATWERTPWSFVFDWFINVGDFLSSLREIELEVVQSYASVAIEAKTKVSCSSSEWHWSISPLTYDSFYISRIIDVEPPAFPLVDKRWRNLTRTIDLISLLLATFKRMCRNK